MTARVRRQCVELKAEVDAAKALVVKAIQDQGAKFLADAVTAMKK